MGKKKQKDEKRKILFRGRRRYNGEWVEGSLVHIGDFCGIIEHNQKRLHEMDRIHLAGTGNMNGFATIVPFDTVGQFTGLYDKNGTKIFEGDVINYSPDWRSRDDNEKYVVEWKNESCGFEPFSDSMDNCHHCGGGLDPAECEVIGNIYDNPELFK